MSRASSEDLRGALLVEADLDGVFPEGSYATTNFATDVRLRERGSTWRDRRWTSASAWCATQVGRREPSPMHRVKKGDLLVVGDAGVCVRVPADSPAEDEPADL